MAILKTSQELIQPEERVYIYNCITNKARKITGEIRAKNIRHAKIALEKQGLTVKKLKIKSKLSLNYNISINNITPEEIALYFRQMSTMISAGIPLVQAFDAVIEGTENVALKNLIKKIKSTVETGSAFSDALKKNPKYFDSLICNLIASGEQSGTLELMLDRIATYKERTESLKRKIKKALYYPIAIFVIALIVSTILLIKVVPTFEEMFNGFDAELPAFTAMVLELSRILQEHGGKLFIALISFIFSITCLYKKNRATRDLFDDIILKVPIMGLIMRKSIIARFARTLATTFAAGVPLTDALTSVAKASGNIVYFKAIIDVRNSVSSGQQMYFAMKKTKLFPNIVIQMISIGEESGSLDKMLEKVANIYEEEVNITVDSLATLLEPFIMVILGLMVGSLVIAMYLPIFKLGSVM